MRNLLLLAYAPPLLGIRGTVTDTGGNVTRLDVFEVRALDDAALCRGER